MKRKLQVFVSSTYVDLKIERQAAVEALLKSGHIPAGMELFAAGDKSQMITIERWIDESDVYMLILGGRYGSIEPISGLSYTEREYDYAVAQGKPLFSVVIQDEYLEDKVKSGGTSFLETERQSDLKRFRAKVLSNISSFFRDIKDIKLSIYESMSEFQADEKLKGWVLADNIQEIKILSEEVTRLRRDNDMLKDKLAKAENIRPTQFKNKDEDGDRELIQVLYAITITVPSFSPRGKESTTNLFDVAYNNRDTLINGVTDAYNQSEVGLFFYNTVLPKLQAYGLAENEKVAGVRYRRSYLNKTGIAFFARMEKMVMLSQKNGTITTTSDATVDTQIHVSKDEV